MSPLAFKLLMNILMTVSCATAVAVVIIGKLTYDERYEKMGWIILGFNLLVFIPLSFMI
jgi:hypothetical protein